MKKQVKKAKKFNVKVFAMIMAIVVFLVASLFVLDTFAPANPKVYHRFALSTIFGSFDGDDTPNSYYQVQIQKSTVSGEKQYSCINTEIRTTNSENVKEIWINLSDLYDEELKIYLSTGWEGKSKYLSERTYSKSDIKNSSDGWFRVYKTGKEDGLVINSSGFYGQLRFSFSSNCKVREIVVVDMKGNLGTVTAQHCSNGGVPAGKDKYADSHDNKFYPEDMKNVGDEKTTFKTEE